MLRDLRCFKLEDKDQYSLLLTKHDINLLLSLLAPFVYLNLCPKGTLIDAFGQERSTIRILLRGKVLVFEPIN